MEISFISVGKTTEAYLKEPCGMYLKRIQRYFPFSWQETGDVRSLPPAEMKLKEAEMVFKLLSPGDQVYLLDETGASYTSVGFSAFITSRQQANVKKLVFILGGAHGFSEQLYQRAQGKVSLSAMTFPHQMVRLIFLEQLYRACTIMRNEPYHH